MLKVSELAALAKISVRTLHYYDELGLLQPTMITDAGYRLYSDENIEKLQQILFYRQLNIPLKQIKRLMDDPDYDHIAALEQHQLMLLKSREQLDILLSNLEQTILVAKGETTMSKEARFAGFSFDNNEYEQEASERYGDDAVDDANKKVQGNNKAFGEQMADRMNELYRELAELRALNPRSEQAQTAIGKWYTMLNEISTYSPAMFRSLGEMYIQDERFTANIDQFGTGLALFMKEAMDEYATRLKSERL
ncbi:MerR family transcriptional regulator [Paenibacillus yanchengensis]|uniref:MerR family transcriptional regulator n=1 Tax=Paenibacillus yanchengensis TaxID=2035833 RepID=A0ABW4YP54_9BACL